MNIVRELYYFFVWCAGSDRQLLSYTPGYEKTKHSTMGALVLVPAVLGFVSMSYAAKIIPQVRDIPLLNFVFGFGWACIIFTFDRYIVSTFRKSNSIKEDSKSLTFLTRAVFSIVVGIIIAHPLVLGIFSERIEKEFKVQRALEEKQLTADFEIKIKPIKDDIKVINDEISSHELSVSNAEQVYITELDGTYGKSSGVKGDNKVAARKREILESKKTEGAKHKKEADDKIKVLEDNITNLRKELADKIIIISIPADYLAREEKLANLAANHPVIRNRKIELILFFVFVDLLPILFKLATRKEAYDYLLEKTNNRTIAEYNNLDDVFNVYLANKKEEYKNKINADSSEAMASLWGFSYQLSDHDLTTKPIINTTEHQSEVKAFNNNTEYTLAQIMSYFVLILILIATASFVSLFVYKKLIMSSPSEQNAYTAALTAGTLAVTIIGLIVSALNKKVSLQFTRS